MTARRITAALAGGWGRKTASNQSRAAQWKSRFRKQKAAVNYWGLGAAIDAQIFAPFGEARAVNIHQIAHHKTAQNFDKCNANPWGTPVNTDAANQITWGSTTAADSDLIGKYKLSEWQDRPGAFLWSDTKKTAFSTTLPALNYSPPSAGSVVFNLAGSYSPPSSNAVNFKLLEPIESTGGASSTNQLINTASRFKWTAPPPKDEATLCPWGAGVSASSNVPPLKWEIEQGDPYKPEPTPIDIKTSYLILNTITLNAQADATPLAFSSFSISMDIDANSYGVSINLDNEASFKKALVNGNPTSVELTINGTAFVFLIDSGVEADGSALKSWQVKGATRSKMLAAPYAATRSKTNSNAIDAAAQATTELAPYGFLVDWPTGNDRDAVSWLLPPGVYSYQGLTPLGAVKRLAATVGAVVLPSISGDGVTIRPRWPLLPWQLYNDAPDVITHYSLITSRQSEYNPAPAYNEVTASGETVGTRCRVYRADSGGGTPAPEIVDPWLTENPANIQRGAQTLANYAPMVIESIGVSILEAAQTPLAMPGDIIEVQHPDPAQTWRGLVLSCAISPGAGGLDLTQSLKIARPI